MSCMNYCKPDTKLLLFDSVEGYFKKYIEGTKVNWARETDLSTVVCPDFFDWGGPSWPLTYAVLE